MAATRQDTLPVIRNLDDFDPRSGNCLERLVFNHRLPFLLCMLLATLVLGYMALTRLELRPSFDKMLPQSHPYIQNYLENRPSLRGLGNAVRVVVENTQGDIFDPGYLQILRHINDELFLSQGVDRAWVKSLWSPAVRWTEVTEEGFQGGPVMPDGYQGAAGDIEQLRQNIERANIVGSLVARDFKSSMLVVPLLDQDSATGKGLDYHAFSQKLEQLRSQYQASGQYRIHVIGFAKLMGDLIDGLIQVMAFFALAVLTSLLIIYCYTRCVRSTLLVVLCSLTAVVWQLGIVAWLGYAIDPYSILVPFLIFAIGVSHAAQKMNGILQDIGRGTHRQVAARYTFRRLFLAGVTALLADAVGFAVLMLIDIPVIQDLAITASIGVAVLIFTSLLLMPVALSYVGVGRKAAERALHIDARAAQHRGFGRLWDLLDRFTERKWASVAVLVALALGALGIWGSLQLKIGDLDSGAPELRADSRYNLDNAYITQHYALSSDTFAVMVKTAPEGCLQYQTLVLADRLAWELQQLPGVQTTVSLANAVRQITAGTYEGNPRLNSLQRNQDVLNYAAQQASVNAPELFNNDCSLMPVIAYLKDHRADTLAQVAAVAERFAQANSSAEQQFLLAAGSAGIEAATNVVVREANQRMLLLVYLAVTLFCLFTFRSWRATLVAILPLMLTSVLCEALMVAMGIGVKVATLPVIALGVGIGVDYALYLLSVQLHYQRAGLSLAQAYQKAVAFTGRVVGLVGITLAAGVVGWAWSPIKFQADMGLLLTFMFLWNMLGALVLIPALSHFLLRGQAAPAPAEAPATSLPQTQETECSPHV
ncbi:MULTISPECIES: efflux RND transporter permease subunit [Pseudomonas]|uniref:RND transporter n=1 Tax=Pseudomonas plecoglossicida TaxID=70775 RepID=A0ABX4TWL0_PSEDL|nr:MULTISPECIES: MMPL family transporter [Pseudomonas]PLU84624.1 RND transporter [Pseudomonas plecoglossicida]PLU90355.1 RND transporter [Pseudomonas plecoglossicida]PLV02741.1 RND transporter [Pseudomonas plecoglossicida]PLV10883.1 RND transporter [Pseudomonas plecoglossicida]QNT38725.1 RND family transporter [Pseudomonas asiatica]